MNNKTILQVPLDISLRDQALQTAENLGFSSLQEAIRVFLKSLANQSLSISFNETERLSLKAEKRYAKMIEEVKSGKEKAMSFDKVDDLMEFLNS